MHCGQPQGWWKPTCQTAAKLAIDNTEKSRNQWFDDGQMKTDASRLKYYNEKSVIKSTEPNAEDAD